MLVELVMSYYLANTEPIFLRTPSCPCATTKTELHVRKEYTDYYIDLSPYVLRDVEDNITGRAGVEIEAGFNWKDISLGYYHHSSHNLDTSYGSALEVDGFKFHWRLSK
jgi:hypothetical protein